MILWEFRESFSDYYLLCCVGVPGSTPCATRDKKDGTTLTRSPNRKNLFNEINASDKQNLYLTSPTGGLYYTLLRLAIGWRALTQ